MSFTQYLKDTRTELRHVAWPTRTQTVVYTVLVALISVGVALYLGFFDFAFTTGLTRALRVVPQADTVTQQQAPAADTNSLVEGLPIKIVASSTPVSGQAAQ